MGRQPAGVALARCGEHMVLAGGLCQAMEGECAVLFLTVEFLGLAVGC